MSAELPATPYINANDLRQYTTRTVRLIGKTIAPLQNGTTVQLEASDSGTVLVHRNGPWESSPYAKNRFVCVTGVVQADLSVRESTVEGWGNDFDLAVFNSVVNAKQKNPSVFI